MNKRMDKTIKEEVRRLIKMEFFGDANRELRTDNDYTSLSIDIEEIIKKLNINTLKRFFDHWGKGIDYKFSNATLDAIAGYIGYSDWKDLEKNINSPKSDFSFVAPIEIGDEYLIKYSPDRVVKLKLIGKNRYRVISSSGSKLKVNDECTADSFDVGSLFCVTDVVREGVNIGQYRSAPNHFITKTRLIRKKQSFTF
jgi:hypothetical protein